MSRRKPRKPTNNEKAVMRVRDALLKGAVLTVHASSGLYTVGAYTPAVGPRGFAVYGYGRETIPARAYTGANPVDPQLAEGAAWAVVHACGSTRAREAALAWERRAARAA
jgi:hypothetical protein